MSDESAGKSPFETAKQVWKRTERARAVVEATVEIPLVIWGASGNLAPQRVQTDVPGKQRIELRVEESTQAERDQGRNEQWAHAEVERRKHEDARLRRREERTDDRSPKRDR